jgi:hypothetical protein
MTGVNTTGNASGDNVLLGRGRIYVASLVNDLPGPYRDVGNVTDFQTNASSETLDRKNFRSGLATIDKKIVLEQSLGLSFALDETTFDNLALFFSGSANNAGYTSENGTGVSAAQLSASVVKGQWYELKTTADGRYYDLDGYDATATPAAGQFHVLVGGSIVPANEVEFDLKMGLVRVLTTNGDSGALTWTMTAASGGDKEVDEVRALSQSSVQVALKFVSENPANNDQKVEYQFHKVTLLADGDMSLIGDELASIPISGQVEENTTADPDSPYLTIRLPDAA